jgi:hypothetical protein
MSEGLSANEREEQRLAKALNRVRTPVRASSSPVLARSASKPSFQDVKRAQQQQQAQPAAATVVEKKAVEASRPVVQRTASPVVARKVVHAATPAPSVRVVPAAQRAQPASSTVASVSRAEYELSDAQLEARCMQWLEKVEPLLGGEAFEFEMGEEMRKSPRVV